MKWLKIAKWAGLGLGVVLAGVATFVLTRYAASSSTYSGKLEDLAPAHVTNVIYIDDVAKRHKELREFMEDGLLSRQEFAKLEACQLWQSNAGKSLGPSLQEFKDKKLDGGVKSAESQLQNSGGLALFKDVLAGELLICTDIENEKSQFVMLSRVSRKVRFYWQFAGWAPAFAPSGADKPKLEFENGVLLVTLPPAKSAPGAQEPATPPKATQLYLTLLDDVMVISSSTRLLNATIKAHEGPRIGLSTNQRYASTLEMVDAEAKKRYAINLWLDLDRLREKLKPVDKNGQMVSPVDAYNTIPSSVIKLNYDVLGPINKIVEKDLDTRPFCAAFYGLDLSDSSAIMFDQYLLADEERIKKSEYDYLRKTWAQKPQIPSQLAIFPPDLVTQVSYGQSLETINNDVLDEASRASFIGDFTRVLQGIKADQVVMGVAPRHYQPDVTEISGVPLPAFIFAFHTPGAQAEDAGRVLSGFLDNMLGRKPVNPGDPPPKQTRVMEPDDLAGHTVYRLRYKGTDEKERLSNATRLTEQTYAAIVGQWLLITNSAKLLEHAFTAKQKPSAGLYHPSSSPWRDLPEVANATVYADFRKVAGFLDDARLLKTIRDAKYNPNQIEGRDPGKLRQEIARMFGLDPNNVENLKDARVDGEFQRRKQAWIETCRVEGDKYINDLRADLQGLTFFQDFAMFTTFDKNGLHARGILRIR